MTKPTTTMYQNFLDSLYNESPKAAFQLEAMRYSLAAETGLNERDALEVCVRIVAGPRRQQYQPVIRRELINQGATT
jgi:hypothetical protein